jgi:tetratricopeptide (TPR) repeat protein
MSDFAHRALRPFVVVALALVLGSGSAHGADVPDANKAAAKEHYQRGTSYYDLGRYGDAIKEFEAAYELKNDPAFLYNLAQSYRQVGDPEQALHFYRTYLRYVPKAPNRAEIEQRIASLEKQMADKSAAGVQPPPPPPPGNGLTTTPPPPASNPPPAAEAPAPSVTVTGTPAPPAYTAPPSVAMTPPPPVPWTRGRKLQMAGLATGAAGVVMFVIGIVEGVRASSASDEINQEATRGVPYDPSVQDRGQSAEKAEGWLISLGLVAVGAGAGLWFYGRRVAAAESTTSYRISFAPVVSPSSAGALLRIGF